MGELRSQLPGSVSVVHAHTGGAIVTSPLKIGTEPPAGPACKLCGAAVQPLREHGSYTIVRCRACGFMFAIVPPECDLRSVYADDAYWSGDCEYGYSDYEQAWRDARRLLLARLDRLWHLTPSRTMLEI